MCKKYIVKFICIIYLLELIHELNFLTTDRPESTEGCFIIQISIIKLKLERDKHIKRQKYQLINGINNFFLPFIFQNRTKNWLIKVKDTKRADIHFKSAFMKKLVVRGKYNININNPGPRPSSTPLPLLQVIYNLKFKKKKSITYLFPFLFLFPFFLGRTI